MGDAADYYNEQGELAYILHLRGECDIFCEYCEDEEPDEEVSEDFNDILGD